MRSRLHPARLIKFGGDSSSSSSSKSTSSKSTSSNCAAVHFVTLFRDYVSYNLQLQRVLQDTVLKIMYNMQDND
jgi:hypothetical protein